jgi:hypothetical protein
MIRCICIKQNEQDNTRKALQISQDSAADALGKLAACTARLDAATARCRILEGDMQQALAQKNSLEVEIDEIKHQLQGVTRQMEGPVCSSPSPLDHH